MPIQLTAENKEKYGREALVAYRDLLRATDQRRPLSSDQRKTIRRAFEIAFHAHKDTRRQSGEPYILHPLAVARIAVVEMGLGTTSIICALLHDVVEDTEMTLEEIEKSFGKKVASIIDGLTKVTEVVDHSVSLQAENFRKVLLTLSDDVRVILLKIADRLHNMRTLAAMAHDKQLKIASETLYLYAPIAHRLGFYAIKSEMEDLSMKISEPVLYRDIEDKLEKTKAVRNRFISQFIIPLKNALEEQGIHAEIFGRPKSVFSIWNKMRNKNVPVEEVYDVFAIRIIIDDAAFDQEKAFCWRVYSVVTDFYRPNPSRLRDWISTPKANGYEALHTTVMSPTGKWVEVQIRTRRMDDIAEKGLAAHYKYKEGGFSESNLDVWLKKIRELLANPDPDALKFLDDFKLNLFAEEIFVFTPKGELRTLPKGASALDFAFDIHSEIGMRCIGVKVNQKLVPLSEPLRSGDQVEIITSKKQKPKEDWLQYVKTAKAKSKIKGALKEEKKKLAEQGKTLLEKKLEHFKIRNTAENLTALTGFYKIHDTNEFFCRIALDQVELGEMENIPVEKGIIRIKPAAKAKESPVLEQILSKASGKPDHLLIGDSLEKIDYKLSPCCNPIPGDDVFGFITVNEGIKIHRVNCPNAVKLLSNFAYRLVKARWVSQQLIAFLAGIKVTGIDEVGIVNNITKIISDELRVNIRSINFESDAGTFEGYWMKFIPEMTTLMPKNCSGIC
ncbi:MAG: bifunctional (p)ppGpp synthetase/guanosine-3',5'-bis(diphosphate) 3'-pyrophosphohydrolase [Bacteroidetes bacterium]|nr:bifunctional (p)ppGpp synthetase/guanosine-3',5'-bis(diphosphate) 3'-pyrophosphohydrolase [Bacteroidota bacterium]